VPGWWLIRSIQIPPCRFLCQTPRAQIVERTSNAVPMLLEISSNGRLRSVTHIAQNGAPRVFLDPVTTARRLIIAGAGHIAQPLATIGSMLGFHVTVVDDRGAFANRERFPSADEIIVRRFTAAIESLNLDRNCYLVSMTRGHAFDEAVVRAALKYPDVGFIGMIESRRMGFPKALLRIGGRSFIDQAARVMLPAVSHLVIVLGAHADRVPRAIPPDPRIKVVYNPNYPAGQLSSVRASIKALSPDCAAALTHLTDHPGVALATFKALVSEFERAGQPIVVARYRGRWGYPVVFARGGFGELIHTPDDRSARFVVNAVPARVAYLDTEDPAVVQDLDTPADLVQAGLLPLPVCRQ